MRIATLLINEGSKFPPVQYGKEAPGAKGIGILLWNLVKP